MTPLQEKKNVQCPQPSLTCKGKNLIFSSLPQGHCKLPVVGFYNLPHGLPLSQSLNIYMRLLKAKHDFLSALLPSKLVRKRSSHHWGIKFTVPSGDSLHLCCQWLHLTSPNLLVPSNYYTVSQIFKSSIMQ